jgi:hypothetical protein
MAQSKLIKKLFLVFFFGDKNLRPLSETVYERKGLKYHYNI